MIASIVTRGFGSWGSVNLIVTRGYGVGAAIVVKIGGVWTEVSRDLTWTETPRDLTWS